MWASTLRGTRGVSVESRVRLIRRVAAHGLLTFISRPMALHISAISHSDTPPDWSPSVTRAKVKAVKSGISFARSSWRGSSSAVLALGGAFASVRGPAGE